MHLHDEVQKTYGLTAAEYAEAFYQELDGKPLDRVLLRRFAARAKNKGRTADIGCGCGHTTAYLRHCGVKDLVGIDLSPDMIAQAKRLNPYLNFEVGNILSLGEVGGTFGSILAFYSIVHFNFTEVESAFHEFFRTLKAGGELLFSFHIGEEKTELDEFLGVKTRITFYYFNVDHIHEMLNSAGFRIAETVIRYPYTDVEFPSKRAYITASKPNKY
jgi:SAM-dependent methyltransferase